MKLFQSFWKILFVLPVLCAGVPGAAACPASGVAYVDSGVARTGTGNSWRDAFSSLQAALDCGTVREIHAAAGVYRPSSRTEASDPRSATFKLRNNLKIYGGYPPGGGVRDWQTHRTVLSGDIDANDITDGNGTTVSIQGANSYHVAISENMDDTAMLDGFIITGGQATAKYPKSYGGGMTNRGGSPVLANLIFSGNQAIYGGGLFNEGSPALTNVTFSGNQADETGGGMYNINRAALTNVIFSGNQAGETGGGMYNSYFAVLTNVIFSGNQAADGGGLYNRGSPVLANVVFSGNQAGNAGGGMYNTELNNASPNLVNVTFSGNQAGAKGGGMYNAHSIRSLTVLNNVILWGNTAAGPGYDEFDNDGSAEIRYSLIRGSGGSGAGWNVVLGKDLGGNSDIDPLFVSPVTEAAPTVAGDLRLQPGSPAIDRGGNVSRLSGISADPDGNPRLADCNVDIGAYESPGTGAACDLTVALAGPAEATMGYPARYRLSVTNRGTGDARGITDLTLPANARLHGIEGDAEFAATLARADGILSLDVLLPANTESILTVSLIPLTTDTLIFAPGEITIDPLNRVPETDETNNALSVSVALPVSSCPSAEIIYTDSLAETERHGLTWKTALNSLADALAAAEICSEIREIHVAEGVYKPSTRTEISNPRTASFRLHNNLKIYGGYPHGGGARDWRTHRTVLSGDIDTDDITDGDGVTVSAQGMNSYHVMFSENTNAMLDGFIVTGGQATAADQPHNKVISGCSRAYYGGGHYGGGMCNYDGSPALTNIMFSGNQATYGGGMYNYKGSPALTNVMFSGNQADKMGGGMYTASSPALTNVIFNGNQAVEEGGGVYNLGASALTNVAFNGNRAGKDGGGMYNNQGTPTLINVTFSGNPAGGGMVNHGSSPHLISVILWDNFPYEMRNREYEEWYMANAGRNPYYPVWRTIPSIPKIRHSLIRGSRNGSGGWNTEFGEDLGRNLDANPLFTEDLRLLPGSPAIDAGDINAVQDVAGDLAGNPRIVGGTVDIGAYEAIFDALSFSAAVYLQDESGRAAEISVSRNSNSPDGEVSVEYRTVPGMASEGEDYAAASGVLTWADGDIAAKTFSITVHDDVLAEQEETAGLELRNPVGNAVLGGLARAELLILDDDIAHPGTQNGAVFSLLNAAPPSPGGTEPILYQVIPAPEHTGMPADILGIAVYAAFKGQSRYSHNGRGWRPWDGDPANLGVMQRHERLAENFEIALPPVPSDIAAGEYRFYAGYRPDNGGLVLNSGNPLRLYTGNTAQGIAGSYFEPLLSIAGDRFSSRARIDLEHIGLPADILAVKLWQPLEGPASFQARNAYGRWQPWPGDLAELPAMARYESLPPLLDIDILQPSSFGFPSPGEAVVYVGYRLNDGTLIYPDRDFPRLRINKPAYRAGLRTETDFITWAYQNPAAGNPLSAPPSVPLSAEVAIRADPGHTGRQTHTGLAAVHKTADAPPPLGAWREEELVLLEITPPYSLPRIAPLPVFTWFDGDYFIYAGYSQPENDILVHSDGMLLSGE